MLKKFKDRSKKILFRAQSLVIAKFSKWLLYLLGKTCRFHIEGLEHFCTLSEREKCILMLWHNQLALIPFILSQYTYDKQYTAVISASRDGDILAKIVHSYRNAKTIRVPHLTRHQALRTIIQHVQEQKEILIITPDGPRGPRYEVKPGIAMTALETQAYVVSLKWQAKSYWELNTWDRFRLPKPFTTIHVSFDGFFRFDQKPSPSLEEVQSIFKAHLLENST